MLAALCVMGWALAGKTLQVQGVYEGDVLYIRERPDASAPIVGAIPSAMRVTVESVEAGWAKVEYNGVNGYSNATFLAEPLPIGLPAKLSCHGTEPFWSLSLDGTTATLETPDSDGKPSVARLAAPLRPAQRPDLWVLPGSDKGLNFVMISQTGRCSDGMSDSVYPFEVLIRRGPALLSGCCAPPR